MDFHAPGNGIVWSLNSTSNFTINAEGVVSVAGNLDREVSLFLYMSCGTLCN